VTLTGCARERLIQQPVLAELECPEPNVIPSQLLIQRPLQPIPLGIEGFSGITYGDALILWGRDRETITTLNAQLQAIEDLNE
jgi:hypothetical protein